MVSKAASIFPWPSEAHFDAGGEEEEIVPPCNGADKKYVLRYSWTASAKAGSQWTLKDLGEH